MAYSNSKLVSYTKLSPNYNKRSGAISKITIHHMAGNLTVEACGNGFSRSSRQASSNYGIGSDGRIGLYVEEKNRAWTSSNAANDYKAVTIEVANDGGKPDWHVSDKALSALIDLCVDICERNHIKALNYTGDATGNLTRHNMFAATTCPGPYLQSKFPYIVQEVNKRLATANKELVVEEQELYRVRKSWDNPKSQIGAFWSLSNAKALANKNPGYTVYNRAGRAVYTSVNNSLKIGDKVTLTSGATYYDGMKIPGWVFRKTLNVRKIQNDRIVISTLATGDITGVVHKKYLKKVN